MTEGNPLRRMLVFGAPVMAGGILQQMYNMADAVIAGRFIGSEALASVSNCFYVVFFVTIMFLGIGQGASIVISQLYGSGETKRVRSAVDTITVLLAGGGLNTHAARRRPFRADPPADVDAARAHGGLRRLPAHNIYGLHTVARVYNTGRAAERRRQLADAAPSCSASPRSSTSCSTCSSFPFSAWA